MLPWKTMPKFNLKTLVGRRFRFQTPAHTLLCVQEHKILWKKFFEKKYDFVNEMEKREHDGEDSCYIHFLFTQLFILSLHSKCNQILSFCCCCIHVECEFLPHIKLAWKFISYSRKPWRKSSNVWTWNVHS